jgi:hypothetical protein
VGEIDPADLAGFIIVIICLVFIGLGKDVVVMLGIVQMIVGFLFGKHTRKISSKKRS